MTTAFVNVKQSNTKTNKHMIWHEINKSGPNQSTYIENTKNTSGITTQDGYDKDTNKTLTWHEINKSGPHKSQ